ncbi:MAG TPA: PHB depolymerase family esterase [Anaeromyxobacteraceae bacterium]|nr:PHB depolymerase family esterase [Anaeromyxobacteraceae bacterium]
MLPSRPAAALALATALGGCAGAGSPATAERPPGHGEDAVFTRDSPLASGREMARRTLTPLTWFHAQRTLAERSQALVERPVDLARERFSVYVPGGAPPAEGWGLLVFVPPWDEPTRPRRWRGALDRHALVFVAAERSGNDAAILDRRLPLALLAWENARARWPIDPRRVYVGGFSGGSRVAQIAALAYPDVFRGALLHAGSDPIDGSRGTYIPPADLFRAFQNTPLVYVTGDRDEVNLRDDEVSRASMRERCVLDLRIVTPHKLAHEALDPGSLDRALDALERPPAVEAGERERCRARLEREVSSRLSDVEADVGRGDRAAALARIKAADAEFGGLAAPAIVELERRRLALP